VNDTTPRILIHALDAGALGDGLDAAHPVQAWDALSRRAPILAREGDLVVTDRAPDPEWLALLDRLGIGGFEIATPTPGPGALAHRIMKDQDLLDRLRAHGGAVHPYMGTPAMHELAHTLGLGIHAPPRALVDRLNRKSSLAGVLERAGVPRLASIVCPRDGVLACVRTALDDHGASVVRADVSIGGFGVWAVEPGASLDALERGLGRSGPDRLFLIEPKLDIACSPNVQYDLRLGADPEPLGISDQRFGGDLAFGGNSYPSERARDPEILAQSDAIARTLVDMGYRGLVGIDFIATASGSARAIEINPRVNTSTFALELARRTGAPAFELATSIPCEGGPPDAGLYDPVAREGIVPIMGPIEGRPVLDAAALGASRSRCAELIDAVRSRCAAGGGGACAQR